MKFLRPGLCCAAVKCHTPQPRPQPSCIVEAYSTRRRGSRGNRQHRRINKLQYEWQPSLATILEDGMGFEVLPKMEVRLESHQEMTTKNNNPSTQRASASTYAREAKQANTFRMAIPTFVPSALFF